jgi:hypothetical protein
MKTLLLALVATLGLPALASADPSSEHSSDTKVETTDNSRTVKTKKKNKHTNADGSTTTTETETKTTTKAP